MGTIGNMKKTSYKTKNDRAMVSGVSSILRKIKDRKNRKEVAGDMVNQFNREGVNYNKEKFLKNSRSFGTGGSFCPEGNTWSQELNRCVTSYEDNYVKGLKKERQDIIDLYKSGAEKAIIDSRTQAFKNKYKNESGEPMQLFCDKYNCKIPPETFSSTTTTINTSPKFSIKGIVADQYIVDPKTYGLGTNSPEAKDYRYRIETDKGFDILPSKKAFDEWKTKYATEYQPYYTANTGKSPVLYNQAAANYNETPTLKYEEPPVLVKKYGGTIYKRKPKFQLGTNYMPTNNQRLLPRDMSFSTTAPYTFGKTPYLGKRYGDLSNKATVGDVSKGFKKAMLNSEQNLGYSTVLGRDRFNISSQISPFATKQNRIGPINLGYSRAGETGVKGNISYTPKKSFSGELNVGQDLALRYNRGKDDQGKVTNVGATFNPGGPFSFDYSQTFRPGQFIPNQQVRGNINTDGFTGSAYRNISQEEGKTYGGNFSKNTGEITYGGNVDYGPRGLKNLYGNLSASDLYNLYYQKNRLEDDTFENTIGADFQLGDPFSLNYSRTFSPGQTESQTLGGTLNLPNTQASLSKTIGGEESGKYTGSLNTKIGPVNLTASGTKMGKGVQDYNVGANIDLIKPTLKNPKRGTLNLSGSYGKTKEDAAAPEKPKYNVGLKYNYAFKKGGKNTKGAKLSKLYKTFKLKK